MRKLWLVVVVLCIIGCEPAWALEGSLLTEPASATSGDVFVFDGKRMARSSNLHWDLVNSRLGLGTGSPNDTLDVRGPVYIGDSAPGVTAQKLYASGGQLYWSGSLLTTGGLTPPGGGDTQVQFNDAGSFGGKSVFVFDKSTDELSLTGAFVMPGISAPTNKVQKLWATSGGGVTGDLYWGSEKLGFAGDIPGPGGSSGSVQFNDSVGGFGGSSKFIWDDAWSELFLMGTVGYPTQLVLAPMSGQDAIVSLRGDKTFKLKYDNANTGFGLVDVASYRWFVDNTGNMVIGNSTSPGAKLEVQGQVKITGGSPGVGKVLTSDGAGLATWESAGSGAVSSVFTRTGAVVAASGDYDTDEVTEAGNLYYTDTRARASITGGASSIVTNDLATFRALISNTNGKVAVSTVTSTELSYVDGVTSALQTQLNAKAPLASPMFTGSVGLPGTGIWESNVGIGITSPLHEKLNINGRIYLADSTAPGTTSNRLYSVGGSLYWNGVELSSSGGGVTSVFTRTGAVTAQSGDYNTSQVTEGSNLYFTDERARGAISGAASTIAGSNLTASSALQSNASGKVEVANVTAIELGHLAGVTGALQSQLNAKAPLVGPSFTGTVTLPNGSWSSSGVNISGIPFSASGTIAFTGISGSGPHLTIDGLGQVTRTTISGGGTPGGSDTQVQFNDSGSFGGDSGFTFDKTSKVVSIAGPVGGNAQMALTASAGTNAILGLTESGGVNYQIRNLGSDNRFEIYDGSSAAVRMAIQSDGKIGMGLVAPQTNLHVYGSDATSVAIDAPANKDVGVSFRKAGVQKWSNYVPASSDDFYIYSNTSPAGARAVFTGPGQVGFGTSTPEANARLHVHGSGGTAGVFLNDSVPTTTTGKLYRSGSDLYWSGSKLGVAGSSGGDYTYNAADYGTPGTQAAIVAAIAAAHAAGGGVVFIPAGIWEIGSQIAFTVSTGQRVSLLGEGAHLGGTVLRRMTDFGSSMIGLNSTSENSIRHIMFDSPGVKSTNAVAHIHSYYGEGHVFSDLYLQDGYYGIQFSGPRVATLSNTRIQAYYHGATTYGAGIWVTGAAGYPGFVLIDNSWVGGGNNVRYNYGMQVDSVDVLQVSNSYFGEQALANVVLDATGSAQLSGVLFSNCWFDAPAQTTTGANMYASVMVSGNTTGTYGLVTIDGCTFQGRGPSLYVDFGFYVTTGCTVKGVSLTDNTFFWHRLSPIGLYAGTGYNIVGNHIMDGSLAGSNLYDGIAVDGATKTHIASNKIGWTFPGMATSNMRYGIAVVGGDYHTVIGNNCFGNQNAAGVYYAGGSNNYVVANPPIP